MVVMQIMVHKLEFTLQCVVPEAVPQEHSMLKHELRPRLLQPTRRSSHFSVSFHSQAKMHE